ncbi:hypothetical protein IHV25_09765 [Phaeovibrio sulfidiphilus]|uniref:SH3b domain-containing protein n=1 Tax=Phaeovibrio sulfidiphilus TaxID=1220600 RepID=A0A8J6Z1A2_9PROT|nr:hypothetical protein [Phaeovibrio sulfidiphilus]
MPDVPVEALPGSRTPSGQPVPRFVSLRFNVVNLRTGPGKRYPSAWVYRRINLPVEVVAEYDLWRMIRDVDGVTGWVHRSMLTGNRHGLTRDGDWVVRRKPEATSRPLVKVGTGVVIRILKCPEEEAFCRVRLGEVEGWIPRAALWGLYPGEVVD